MMEQDYDYGPLPHVRLKPTSDPIVLFLHVAHGAFEGRFDRDGVLRAIILIDQVQQLSPHDPDGWDRVYVQLREQLRALVRAASNGQMSMGAAIGVGMVGVAMVLAQARRDALAEGQQPEQPTAATPQPAPKRWRRP